MSRNVQEKTGSNRDNRRSIWRFRQYHNEFTLHQISQLERSKRNESLQLLELWSILDYLGVIEAMIASVIKIMRGKDTNTRYRLKTRYSSMIMKGRTILFDEFRDLYFPSEYSSKNAISGDIVSKTRKYRNLLLQNPYQYCRVSFNLLTGSR